MELNKRDNTDAAVPQLSSGHSTDHPQFPSVVNS